MSDKPPIKKRVAVALSGGVDSAVVAALLKAQGADVVALTMLLQAGDAPHEAVRVAQALAIEHHIIDLTDRFASCVMDDFAATYLRGETPLPCAQCNRLIKFGALMEVAKEQGASALATGHYAQRLESGEVGESGKNGAQAQLHRGLDPLKDQSYFLFALSQEQINFARFPLGAMSKAQTRELALRYDLPVAQKKDSQDICFVPCGDYVSVLEKLRPEAVLAGEIVDRAGHVLGQHKGIVHFTVGQRKGLKINDRAGDHNEPLFVLSLDADKRRVIVGPREALAKREVFLRDVNWLGDTRFVGEGDGQGLGVSVRLRSAQQPVPARFYPDAGRLVLEQPAYGVAKGQAGVIYQDSRVLGGGWIADSQ